MLSILIIAHLHLAEVCSAIASTTVAAESLTGYYGKAYATAGQVVGAYQEIDSSEGASISSITNALSGDLLADSFNKS
jgi:hypothetical protein